MATPTCRARSTSHEAPNAEAVGKQVAGTLAPSPTWSPSEVCLRRPCGPSLTITDGMPSRSILRVHQNPEPETSEAFSATVSSASTAGISKRGLMGSPEGELGPPFLGQPGGPGRQVSRSRRSTQSLRQSRTATPPNPPHCACGDRPRQRPRLGGPNSHQ